MKNESVKGTAETAYGTKLETPIAYEGSVQTFESYEELEAAGETPSKADVLKMVNDKRKAAARQKAMNDAFSKAGIEKPTLESSEELRINTIVKALVASGKSDEEALQLAKATLGIA